MCSRSMRARASTRASPRAPATSTARSASASARSDAPDSNSAETSPGSSARAVRILVAEQRHGAVEEADLAGEIAARVGGGRGGREPLTRPPHERGREREADLTRQAAGGLEVEADPRVGLRDLAAEAVQPVRMPLVQSRARRLRQRRVGDVADQRVPEAQRAGSWPADEQVALQQPLARVLDLRAGDAGGERVHRAGDERVARYRAERERGALGRVEPVEPCGEERVERGRERVRRAALGDVGDELLEEERIAAGRLGRPALLRGRKGCRRARRAAPRWLRPKAAAA